MPMKVIPVLKGSRAGGHFQCNHQRNLGKGGEETMREEAH